MLSTTGMLQSEEEQNSFKIKRIKVSRGKKLSYQLHHHLSENWIVVKCMAFVTIDGMDILVPAGESIFTKPGQKYRLCNQGKAPLDIIEVQMGEYLEEDDRVGFEDDLKRE